MANSATDLASEKMFTTTSDEFGDFWFKNLDWNHKYKCKVEKEGYYTRAEKEGNISLVSTEKDVNLGNVYMYREHKS